MWVASGAAGDSRANKLCKELDLQARVMWFDAEANLWELSTREGVAETVAKCKDAGINTIIVDVKPLSGLVLYKSKIAPRLTRSNGKDYPADYDLLATVIDEGHKAGIPVHAAINVFSEGSQKLGGGRALEYPEWQCVEVAPDNTLRRVADSEAEHNAIFVNPLNPEARDYALSIVREICENYAIDGIVFDRMRYPNLYSDFSDLSRSAFEQQIGRNVAHWPQDVLQRGASPQDPVTRGTLFKDWLKFRAGVIKSFLGEAHSVARTARPSIKVGIYVGSWYPLYYDVGVNWASPSHTADYDWWPEGYEETGYADLADYVCTGCYYENATRADAMARGAEEWASVEAAADESINAIEDATFTYGGLYLFQYHGKPQDFEASVRQCLKSTQGCMIFDLVYVRKYDWWDILKRCFAGSATAPHDEPGLLGRLRQD